MTLQPGNRLGNYEIVEKIGAGGMGAVYKGYQTALGRYVAIKVLPPQTAGDPAFGERFAQEARAIGKLRHPNIVTAFDFAHEGDIAYLVSEFIDGGTLADQLGTPLPLDYAIGILTPIAGALDYAHARGIVHRDIKPQNILLTHDGMPVLTDFGLAKIVGPGSGMTQAGSLMGTAEYIAPECASGAEVAGPAADQYALGLIAYQLLTGRHPFPADNPLSALMAHVHKPVPLPSSLGVTLPPGVEAALLRSLAKRPEERFARNGDLVRALSGSTFTALGATPAPASASNPPGTAPSEPPTIPPTAATTPSPLLSPSALVRPPERAASTPPATAPAAVAAAAATAIAAETLVSGGGAAAAGTATTAPIALARKTPWWRRRRMLVLPAALIALAILNLPKQEQRASATSAPPTRTPARTAPVGGGTTATPAATTTPVATVTLVATPTPASTVVRTATPEPAPTFNYGHTPQTATTITPGVFNGDLTTAGEVDYFRFDARANAQIIVEFKGSTLSGGAVALLVQTTANGSLTQLAEDIDSGTGAKISFITTQVGVYYVRVRSARGDTGAYSFGLVTTNK